MGASACPIDASSLVTVILIGYHAGQRHQARSPRAWISSEEAPIGEDTGALRTLPRRLVSDAARGDKELRLTTGMSRGERWFSSLVENGSEVITILEADGSIRYLSPAI